MAGVPCESDMLVNYLQGKGDLQVSPGIFRADPGVQVALDLFNQRIQYLASQHMSEAEKKEPF